MEKIIEKESDQNNDKIEKGSPLKLDESSEDEAPINVEMVISKNGFDTSYNRNKHESKSKLEEHLAKLYGVKNCMVTTSGLNAVSAIINGIMIKNQYKPINIIHGSELYCDTPVIIKYFSKEVGNNNLYEFDITNKEQLAEIVKKIDKSLLTVLFMESCTNPNGYIFDFRLIDSLKKEIPGLIVIVDNTWITCCVFNPFDFDVDYVAVSLTKHYSGGKCIAGALLGKLNKTDKNSEKPDTFFYSAQKWFQFCGIHVSPYNCELALRGLKTVKERVTKNFETILPIAKLLQKNKLDVNYVGLPEHKSHELMNDLFQGIGPGVLTLIVPVSYPDVFKLLKPNPDMPFMTSFGASTTRIDKHPVLIDKTHTRLRLAVGYSESLDDILPRLTKTLKLLGLDLKTE